MTIKFDFIDREKELNHLEDEYRNNDFRFISIIGRRRVGKTRLIGEFLRSKEHCIYFIVPELNDRDVRLGFAKKLHDDIGASFIGEPSWDDIFSQVFEQSMKKRIVLVLDEFQRFSQINTMVPSLLQKYIDLSAKNSKLFFIVSGSSIGMMHRLFDHASPLFGRRTSQINLQPFTFGDMRKWFPDLDIEHIIELYAVYGGTPKYLEDIEYPGLFKNIEKIVEKTSILYTEPEILIKTEFRQSNTYFNILKHIAQGRTRSSEIADCSNIKTTSIDYFLNALMKDVDIVKKEVPITVQHPERSKKAVYSIKDNFFLFWFRFIYPHMSDIEIGHTEHVLDKMKENLNTYIGMAFEEIIKDRMVHWDQLESVPFPFPFEKIGRWWGPYREDGVKKVAEIDLVALNEQTKQVLFIECKWKHVTQKNAEKILVKLKEKSKFVQWNDNKRREYFGIAAKKVEGKAELRKQGFVVLDLDDL